MSNLFDYLLWRGDLPICEAAPLCAVDSMIFARLSYLRFDLTGFSAPQTLCEALSPMEALDADAFFNENDLAFVSALRKAPRFSSLVLSDYIVRRDAENAEQFAAITVHLPKGELCLSFIGTDNTIYGLREDLNMALMPAVPAQRDALAYTQEILRRYPRASLHLCGHSKGGNAALFSAFSLSAAQRRRIRSVENFDGPGFDDAIHSFENLPDALKNAVTYLPSGSIIGRIMTHREEIRIVESNEKGLGQHSLYTWQVRGSEPVWAQEFEPSGDTIHQTLAGLLQRSSMEERSAFVENLSGLIASASADEHGTLSKSWYKSLPELLSTYKDIPDEGRKASFSFLSDLQKSYFSVLKNETMQQFGKLSASFKGSFLKNPEEGSKP